MAEIYVKKRLHLTNMAEILAKKITFIEYGGDICQKRLHLSNMAEIFVKKDYIYRKWRRYLSKKDYI